MTETATVIFERRTPDINDCPVVQVEKVFFCTEN